MTSGLAPRLQATDAGALLITEGPSPVTLATLPPGCALIEQQTEAVHPRYHSISALAGCPGGARWQGLWIVDPERNFTIWMEFSLLQSPSSQSPFADFIRLGARLDPDFSRFELLVYPLEQKRFDASRALALPWKIQGRTLTQIPQEPEESIMRSVDAAQRLVAANPAAASEAFDMALRAHAVLCREVAGPKVHVQKSTLGMKCGASKAAALAAALRFRQHAETGNIAPAMALYQELDGPGFTVDARAQAVLNAGWDALGSSAQLRVYQGPALDLPPHSRPAVHELAFLNEDSVLVRTRTPMKFTIGTSTLEPTEEVPLAGALTDANGKFALLSIYRRCGAYVLGLIPRMLMTNGLLPEKPTRSVPISDAALPETCRLEEKTRADTGGWQALSWTAQGIVVARAGQTRLVPIDANGNPSGAPEPLDEKRAANALASAVPGRTASLPVSGWVSAVPGGVYVSLVQRGPRSALMRPKDWAVHRETPEFAALSPSGKRVAVVFQKRLAILERLDP
ncbi:MAG: hypothetical protein H6714_10010 [Myxococcales bacterium]|nr:hypothetical protein [Myxococcales bacterium]